MGLATVIPPRFLTCIKSYGFLHSVHPIALFAGTTGRGQSIFLNTVTDDLNYLGNFWIYLWHISLSAVAPKDSTVSIDGHAILSGLCLFTFVPLVFDHVHITLELRSIGLVGIGFVTCIVWLLLSKVHHGQKHFRLEFGLLTGLCGLLLSTSDPLSERLIVGHIICLCIIAGVSMCGHKPRARTKAE